MSASRKDTIVALATGALPCAVAMVRVSGPGALDICGRLAGELPPPRTASLRQLRDSKGRIIDAAIVIHYPAPRSYTGEDVVEISAHGSLPVVEALIDELCAAGARHAQPGEFTERAFLNGRLDLAQSEAVADLIGAQSQRAARAAGNALRGLYSAAIEAIQATLTETRAHVEANIDFADEEVPEQQHTQCQKALQEILQTLDGVARRTAAAIKRNHKLCMALVGEPNAGKSTLLNALSGEDMAIVSSTPGTTRDAIGAEISVCGWVVRVIDTAGLRSGGGDIEREGMRRAGDQARGADRVWWVRAPDINEAIKTTDQLREMLELPDDTPIDTIHSKIDLGDDAPALRQEDEGFSVLLSGKTRAGIDKLGEMIRSLYAQEPGGEDENDFSARRRHSDALAAAQQCLERALEQCQSQGAWELIAEELRLAQSSLDEILGKVTSDDLLGEIFSSFCIGK